MRLTGPRSCRRGGNMLQQAPAGPGILRRGIERETLLMMPLTYLRMILGLDGNERNGVRFRDGLLGGTRRYRQQEVTGKPRSLMGADYHHIYYTRIGHVPSLG